MSRRSARVVAALACAVVMAGLPGHGAQAAHVARLDIQPAQVQAGGQVTVMGPPGWAPTPVTITWNALDGPVLGSFPTTTGANASFGPGTITVPSDARPGTYVLFGNQEVPESQPAVRGVPARARVIVLGLSGAALAEPPTVSEGTPAVQTLESLQESGSGAPVPALILVGLAAFVVTVGLGVLLGLAARRKAAAPQGSQA